MKFKLCFYSRRSKDSLGAISLKLFLVMLTSGTLAAEDLPLVGTIGEVQAPNFRRTFSAPSLAEVEKFLAQEVAQHGSNHFSYCRWTVLTNATETNDLARTLKISLLGEDLGFGFRITLRLSAMQKSEVRPLDGVPDLLLYEAGDLSQPTQDPVRLKRDIALTLRNRFDEPLRRTLQEQFFSSIPITRHLDLDSQRLIVPILRSVLPAAEGSVFAARFQVQPPAESRFPVTIKMEAEHGSWNRPLECVLLEFRHPKTNLFQRGTWDQLIATCHQHAVNGVIPVYVEQYRKLPPFFSDGLLEDPE